MISLVAALYNWAPASAEVSGYLKTLWLDTNTVVGTEESAKLGNNRARFTWRDSVEDVQFLLSYDLEWQVGNYLESTQYQLQQSRQRDPYWDLQGQWQINQKQIANHGVYRAYVNVPVGPADIRIGRQQLNWSRTFLWSTFDRFNPYNPLQLEPEERVGVDAMQLIWNFDNGHSTELVSVGNHAGGDAWGLRYRGNFRATDFDWMLADFGNTQSLGFAAAGQIANAGWRMELTQNWSDRLALGAGSRNYQDLVLSLDYTFANNTTVIGEALYRGDGAARPESYDFSNYLAARRTDLAKRYLGLVVSRGFEPIAGIDLSVLYNVDDDSIALVPAVRYSPGRLEDLQLRAGFQFFDGSRGSEFGILENLAFIELQWFY